MNGTTPLSFGEYLILLLRQFAGGPGPVENNLMRFGLPAVIWALLLTIAVTRQRQGETPRERWLILGFGLGFLREAFMFIHVSVRIVTGVHSDHLSILAMEPLEHAIGMLAIAVVAGSFIGYCLQVRRLSIGYIVAGIGTTLASYAVTAPWWAQYTMTHPDTTFHATWAAWAFHIPSTVMILVAIVILRRAQGWLRNTVVAALALFLIGEILMLINFSTAKTYATYLCPLGNTFHTLAIPLFGYVYLREQAAEKRRAEAALAAYQNRLEELVDVRTEALTQTNEQLVYEIRERREAETALARLSHQHSLILDSAGEGIFGVDLEGRHTFVNLTAARMLGYDPEELIGASSHATWHHSYPDGTPYPEDNCPLHRGYRTGTLHQGSDQVLWRRNGTAFPARYMTTPIFEEGELRGAVVTFADISEQKRAEQEITRRNTELAAQNSIADTISQSLELETLLAASLETVLGELNVGAGCIFLHDGLPAALDMEVCLQKGADGCAWSNEVWAQSPCLDISRQAIDTMSPVVFDIAAGSSDAPPDTPTWKDAGRLIAVPLIAKNRPVGAMALSTKPGDGDPTHNLELLTAIGQQIGIAVDNARLYRETQARAAELALLHEASVRLNTPLELDEIYEHIVEQALRLLDCQATLIFLRQADKGAPVNVLNRGLTSQQEAVLATLAAPLSTWLATPVNNRLPITISDTSTDPELNEIWHQRLGVGALLGRPLCGTQEPLGYILFAGSRGPKVWQRSEQELAESFVNLSAAVIEKAQLHQRAERAAALEERQRIASDVHDGLAQTLSYLGHQVDALIDNAKNGDIDHVAETGDQIRKVIDTASQEIRRIIASLQAQPEPQQSLQTLIESTIDGYRLDHTQNIAFSTTLDAPVFVSAAQREQIQRVVQEALLNAQHHADPDHINVSLDQEDGHLVVIIRDDGTGFDLEMSRKKSEDHFGLSIMHARAARLSGKLKINSVPNQGTAVVLRWPCPIRTED